MWKLTSWIKSITIYTLDSFQPGVRVPWTLYDFQKNDPDVLTRALACASRVMVKSVVFLKIAPKWVNLFATYSTGDFFLKDPSPGFIHLFKFGHDFDLSKNNFLNGKFFMIKKNLGKWQKGWFLISLEAWFWKNDKR